jgi:hypothetical protein
LKLHLGINAKSVRVVDLNYKFIHRGIKNNSEFLELKNNSEVLEIKTEDRSIGLDNVEDLSASDNTEVFELE